MLSLIEPYVGLNPISKKTVSQKDSNSATPNAKGMNRYVMLSQLGDGTYGTVLLAQRLDTGEKVAIKK